MELEDAVRIAAPVILSLFLSVGCGRQRENVIQGSGIVEGTEIRVGAEVSGKIKTIRVAEGRTVEVGDTLAVIDDTEYQIQLRQAAANSEAPEAQYRLALAGFRQEDILQARANFEEAEADYRRMKALLETQSVARQRYDAASARYTLTKQAYDKMMRGSRVEEIEIARARWDQAMTQAELLNKRVRDCVIRSTARGIVTLKAFEEGDLVNAGANLFQVTHLGRVHLVLYVSEVELGKIRLGQEARVKIDAYPEREFAGKVVYLSPVAEFTPKNVQTKEERTKLVFGVKIEVDNPDGALKIGLPADATLASAEGHP